MAKLKFDRGLKIQLKLREKGIVPDDEVWKGTLTYTPQIEINGTQIESIMSPSSGGKYLFNPILLNIILGGGTVFTPEGVSSGRATFTGVAFKVIS